MSQEPLLYLEFNKPNKQNVYEINLFENFNFSQSQSNCWHTDWHQEWDIKTSLLKGTVSQTAHVQIIKQKWSDVFKFVICETKWRQQAEDNPHSHGGRRNNSGGKMFFFNSCRGRKQEREKSRRRIRLEENVYKSWLQFKLEALYSSTSNSEFAMNLRSLKNRRQ